MNDYDNNQPVSSNEQKHQQYVKSTEKAMKNSDKIFMGVTLVIAVLFIIFLPSIYKYVSELKTKEWFKKPEVVDTDDNTNNNNNNNNNQNNNNANKPQEETYKAVVCEKAEEDGYLNTTTLYFSKSKLKKMGITYTYDYDKFEKTTLNTFYLQQQSKLANQKGFEMKIDSASAEVYTVNYSLDMTNITNDVLIELEITDRLDNAEDATTTAYKNNGFTCE